MSASQLGINRHSNGEPLFWGATNPCLGFSGNTLKLRHPNEAFQAHSFLRYFCLILLLCSHLCLNSHLNYPMASTAQCCFNYYSLSDFQLHQEESTMSMS